MESCVASGFRYPSEAVPYVLSKLERPSPQSRDLRPTPKGTSPAKRAISPVLRPLDMSSVKEMSSSHVDEQQVLSAKFLEEQIKLQHQTDMTDFRDGMRKYTGQLREKLAILEGTKKPVLTPRSLRRQTNVMAVARAHDELEAQIADIHNRHERLVALAAATAPPSLGIVPSM